MPLLRRPVPCYVTCLQDFTRQESAQEKGPLSIFQGQSMVLSQSHFPFPYLGTGKPFQLLFPQSRCNMLKKVTYGICFRLLFGSYLSLQKYKLTFNDKPQSHQGPKEEGSQAFLFLTAFEMDHRKALFTHLGQSANCKPAFHHIHGILK